jgi:UDP-glucose:(heptosyl)LPS alpha-1,3-glucosyltransferase
MKIAFVLYRYFPFGGLTRDMLRIAAACVARGHQIHAYALSWEGGAPAGVEVSALPSTGLSRHGRNRGFQRRLRAALAANPVECIVGFNKMPGLDIYYAADGCMRAKILAEHGRLAQWLPRYRHFLDDEAAVFSPRSHTHILMISPRQRDIYIEHYGTPYGRLHMLPPGIARDRLAGDDAMAQRRAFRTAHGIGDDELVVLCIGSGFKTKGLDRSLRAFASLPPELRARSRLIAIGDDRPTRFARLAGQLGITKRFAIWKGRDDIPQVLQGGDLLLHPAYYENTGTALLEAVVAGLPVLATATCGYAFHVEAARAGRVIGEPFAQAKLDRALASMLVSPQRAEWRRNGIAYGRSHDLYGMPELAAAAIERLGDRA